MISHEPDATLTTCRLAKCREAEKVRRGWVRSLLSRRKLPSDALAFAAAVLVEERFAVERAVKHGHRTAGELFADDGTTASATLARTVAATPGKATHVLLALAVGALEASVDRWTWRNPTNTARRYLRQLATWGYALSEVEQLVTGDAPSADDDTGEGAPSGASAVAAES